MQIILLVWNCSKPQQLRKTTTKTKILLTALKSIVFGWFSSKVWPEKSARHLKPFVKKGKKRESKFWCQNKQLLLDRLALTFFGVIYHFWFELFLVFILLMIQQMRSISDTFNGLHAIPANGIRQVIPIQRSCVTDPLRGERVSTLLKIWHENVMHEMWLQWNALYPFHRKASCVNAGYVARTCSQKPHRLRPRSDEDMEQTAINVSMEKRTKSETKPTPTWAW